MTPNPLKRRVLLIVEAANPEWVSVPLVGWSLATALARRHEAHIVTQIRNRDAFLRAGLVEGQDFTAIDSEAFAKPMWALGEKLRMGQGKGWTMLQAISAVSYPYFEQLAWKTFGDAIKAGEYDLVHRITPLSPTISSSLAKKCAKANVPFLLGPLNGGVPWPKGFDSERRREKEWLSYLRSAYKLLPGRKSTLKHASAIIAGSLHTKGEVPAKYQDKTVFIPENAIDPERFNAMAEHKARPVRACFIGRMVPYKGPDMLIDAALPLVDAGKLELDLIGDGPMTPHLKAMADGHDGIRFHGWQAHGDVQKILAECNVMAFPSVREFGGGVVLEAMAVGVPPLIVDYAGPGELVSDGIGYKAPLGSRREIVEGFHNALSDLCEKPDELAKVGAAGRAFVEAHFTWDQKARQVSRVYDWVLDGGAKPDVFDGALNP